jgi:LacI family gluconate utilization system Gnt-I transcriptional repressor
MPSPSIPRKQYKKRSESRIGTQSISVTLEHVAKLAGVSRMTVSRALNNPELVNKETLEQIQRVIERTGYIPNMLAGGLATRRSGMVAAIVPSLANSIFVETIQSLADHLWEAGYQLMLGLSGYPATREEALLAAVLSRRPDAICLTGITHSPLSRQRLISSGIPVVETWDLTPTPIDMLVGFSHEKVGEAVAEYLVAKGFRRLGIVSADDERAAARRQGFLSVLAREGIKTVETASVPAPSTLGLGRTGLGKLLDAGFAPDAVFCSSDVLAHGVLEEARLRRLNVPGQLAVIGFGGLEFSPHTVPALSSVAVDREAIGRRAAQMILDRIENSAAAGGVVDVGFRILERETT